MNMKNTARVSRNDCLEIVFFVRPRAILLGGSSLAQEMMFQMSLRGADFGRNLRIQILSFSKILKYQKYFLLVDRPR